MCTGPIFGYDSSNEMWRPYNMCQAPCIFCHVCQQWTRSHCIRSTWSPPCTAPTPPPPCAKLIHHINWDQDYLRKVGYQLVVVHDLHPRFHHLFGSAETARWTISGTQVLRVDVFHEEAGHPEPTLQPVQLFKIFPQSLWQAPYSKPLLQHNLQSTRSS